MKLFIPSLTMALILAFSSTLSANTDSEAENFISLPDGIFRELVVEGDYLVASVFTLQNEPGEETLYVFNRHTGKKIWSFPKKLSRSMRPVFHKGTIYFTGHDSALLAYQLSDGKKLVERKIPIEEYFDVLVTEDKLILYKHYQLVALDLKSLATIWDMRPYDGYGGETPYFDRMVVSSQNELFSAAAHAGILKVDAKGKRSVKAFKTKDGTPLYAYQGLLYHQGRLITFLQHKEEEKNPTLLVELDPKTLEIKWQREFKRIYYGDISAEGNTLIIQTGVQHQGRETTMQQVIAMDLSTKNDLWRKTFRVNRYEPSVRTSGKYLATEPYLMSRAMVQNLRNGDLLWEGPADCSEFQISGPTLYFVRYLENLGNRFAIFRVTAP